MSIATYHPQLEVKLIKGILRHEIAPGVPVNVERYENLYTIDLTQWIGEGGGVKTCKSVREIAGGFTIVLADKVLSLYMESIYALVEPMDIIEIRMMHDAGKARGKLPMLMRGFVSSVRRGMAIGTDGRPARTITIAGQDYGKILQILQIFYLNNSVVGDNILSAFKLFEKYNVAAKAMSAQDFLRDVTGKILNPYLEKVIKNGNDALVPAGVIGNFTLRSSIEGTVSPAGVQNFAGGSLHQLLAQFCDVGPFNEMYVEDTDTAVLLVVRPAPFESIGGDKIQGNAAAEMALVQAKDIVAMDVSRSDAGVANYYWVGNSAFSMQADATARLLAQTGNKDNYVLFDYPNSAANTYGIRKMEMESYLGDPAALNGDAETKAVLESERKKGASWLDRRRAILAESNKDNVVFESGTMRIFGSEGVKAGMFLIVASADFHANWYCYVTVVEQEYVPYQGMFTVVHFERGNAFIKRAQRDKRHTFYLSETEQGGIVDA